MNIRKKMNINLGQENFFVKSNDGIQIIPQIPLNELFGKVKGINTDIEGEEDRL